jgi:phage-related minor tail protein
MLTLKNPFAKSTPATESAGSSMPEADKTLKRWELEQGRTKKRVEELTGQLDTARRTLADAKQAYGEREIEGVDTTEAEAAMQRAEGRVRAFEVALTVAKQKDDAAQAELNNQNAKCRATPKPQPERACLRVPRRGKRSSKP